MRCGDEHFHRIVSVSCSGYSFGDSSLKYPVVFFFSGGILSLHLLFSCFSKRSVLVFPSFMTDSQRQGSRRRQKGSDYTSTSDEEYDSHWTSLKNKRSQPSSASHSPRSQPRPQPVVARHPKSSSRDSEEENHEGEAFHSWSAHSAEIAR